MAQRRIRISKPVPQQLRDVLRDEPLGGLPSDVGQQSQQVSNSAQDTLDTIDDVLGSNQSFGTSDEASPLSPEQLESEESGGGNGPPNDESDGQTDDDDNESDETGSDGAAGGGLYRPRGENKRRRIPNLPFKGAAKNKLVLIAGGGGILSLVAGVALLIISLGTLRVENIVQAVQNRYASTTNAAVGDETENMLSGYIKKSVFPALTKCRGKTTVEIDRTCNPSFTNTSNPVQALYTGWQQTRLENKLANKYGIEFSVTGKPGSTNAVYRMKLPDDGTVDGTVISSKIALGDGNLFDQVQTKALNRDQVRQLVRDSFANESKWKQVLLRYKVGRLLEAKYAIKRCYPQSLCKPKEKIVDAVNDKKLAYQAGFVQRFVEPRSGAAGVALLCLLDTTCDPTHLTVGGDAAPGSASEARTDFQVKLQKSLDSYAEKYGEDSLKKVVGRANGILKDGPTTYATKQLVSSLVGKFGGDAAAQETSKETVAKAIPVAGWINTVSTLVIKVNKAGPEFKAMTYAMNAAAAVNFYSLFQSISDEAHTGNMDATTLGSFSDSLDAGTLANGAGSAAEDSPLYNQVVNGADSSQSSQTASVFSAILPSSYADGTASKQMCPGNTPLPSGKTVCANLVFNGGDTLVSSLSDTIHQIPGWGAIVDFSQVIHSTLGSALNAAGGFIGGIVADIPGVSDVSSIVTNAAAPLLSAVTTNFLPSITKDIPDGAGVFDIVAGGADQAFNDFAHNGLGGQLLSLAQVASIQNQQQAEQQTEFNNQPMFAKIFSTNTPFSLVSRLALVMPDNFRSVSTNAADLLNPINSLGHGFALLFSPSHVFAAQPAQADAFGVPQYGYLTVPTDPSSVWDQQCSMNADHDYQNDATYNSSGYDQAAADNSDPETGTGVNTTANPCMLIMDSVGAAGGNDNSALLTSDDKTDLAK